jgi:DNA polymerase-3 subunit chi
MNRIDLYLLKGNTFSDQIDFCCRLTEKAFPQHPKIHIQTEEAIQNEALNSALWTFKPDSFLPHSIGIENNEQTPITIDTVPFSSNNTNDFDLLILLCKQLPENFQKFKRLCLIVANIDQEIAHARQLYKQLKKTGLEVHIQDMR